MLDPFDAGVERRLGVAVWLDIFSCNGLASHEVREIDDANQAAELVEVAATGADLTHPDSSSSEHSWSDS
ncbi:hypothetical protein [Burkholderia ubonensis]|uniref:hypothetical protein n=1 Tax=Burkholderia ubonensis TaxID=101571 RepID=UPI000A595A0D|nr:hypothetical protein [Burkholderia ubonensis]